MLKLLVLLPNENIALFAETLLVVALKPKDVDAASTVSALLSRPESDVVELSSVFVATAAGGVVCLSCV